MRERDHVGIYIACTYIIYVYVCVCMCVYVCVCVCVCGCRVAVLYVILLVVVLWQAPFLASFLPLHALLAHGSGGGCDPVVSGTTND